MSGDLREAVGSARNRMEDVLAALTEAKAHRPESAALQALYERAERLDGELWTVLAEELSNAA